MNRREFIGKGTLGVLSAASGIARAAAESGAEGGTPPTPGRPNVLHITCHDLGWHLNCYGVRTVNSPNIDALAASGVRFERSYCVAPQCSPSRATIYTGQYPQTNGVLGLAHRDFAWSLRPQSRHLATILRDSGWQTALAGGQHETHNVARMNFEWLGSGGLFRPCEMVSDQCLDFLEHQRDKSRPFYLQVGYYEPHRPFNYGGAQPDAQKGVTVPPYLADDAGAKGEFAEIQGAIQTVDRAIGKVLAALDRLGLSENTLVVFTTDHGIGFPRAKCSVYDPGLQSALIMRWPAAQWPTSGSVITTMVSNIDHQPTLLDLLELPAPPTVQGRSYAALLRGTPYQARNEIFGELTYHSYYDPRRCVRTQTHKLIVNFCNAFFFMDSSDEWVHRIVTKSPSDPYHTFHVPVELYDLREDPNETVNLAESASHRDVRADLLSRLDGWMEEINDPILHGIPMSPMHHRALRALKGQT